MKTFTIVLCLLFTSMSFAQFISTDDKLHIAAGVIISSGTYSFVYQKTKDKKKAFWYSVGTSVLAGITKEAYDSTKKNNFFDTGEAIATGIGGFTTSFTINLFVGNRKRKVVAKLN